jgi:hypothetical protein
MPPVYTHQNVTGKAPKAFRCDLECRTCGAPTANGQACKRRVCMWLPYCYQHTRQIFHVSVAESKALRGTTGLFACRGFRKYDMIAPYDAEAVGEGQILDRYGEGKYALGPYLLGGVDAACRRGVASASNGAFGDVRQEPNVYFEETMDKKKRPHKIVGENREVIHDFRKEDNLGIQWWMFAYRDIAAGEELIADYGSRGNYTAAFQRRESRCKNKFRLSECDQTSARTSARQKPCGRGSRRKKSAGGRKYERSSRQSRK